MLKYVLKCKAANGKETAFIKKEHSDCIGEIRQMFAFLVNISCLDFKDVCGFHPFLLCKYEYSSGSLLPTKLSAS
jgi:hypothetical protein